MDEIGGIVKYLWSSVAVAALLAACGDEPTNKVSNAEDVESSSSISKVDSVESSSSVSKADSAGSSSSISKVDSTIMMLDLQWIP